MIYHHSNESNKISTKKKKMKEKKIDMISFDWIDSTIRSFWYSYVVLVDTFKLLQPKKHKPEIILQYVIKYKKKLNYDFVIFFKK